MEPDLTLIPTDILIGFQGYFAENTIKKSHYDHKIPDFRDQICGTKFTG